MPSPAFLRDLPGESEAWVAEGVVTEEQAQHIRGLYPAPGAPEDALSTQILYATAGVLLGAAGIAFVTVGFESESAFPLLGTALALLVAALVVWRLLPQRRLLSDALLVAGMVPLAFMPFPDDARPVAALAVIGTAAILAWRRDRGFVHVLGVLAFTVASGGVANAHFVSQVAAWVWLGLQATLLAALVGWDVVRRDEAFPLGATFATPAAAISIVFFLNENFRPLTGEGVEIALGAIMLALIVAGLLLKHRGLMLGASIVLGVDAIVFAFDFGGVFLGTGVLVALAAFLIFQAEALKRFLVQ